MCSIYHKTCAKNKEKDQIEKSVFLLRQYGLDHLNGQQFIEKIKETLDDHMLNDYSHRDNSKPRLRPTSRNGRS